MCVPSSKMHVLDEVAVEQACSYAPPGVYSNYSLQGSKSRVLVENDCPSSVRLGKSVNVDLFLVGNHKLSLVIL